MSDFIVGTCLFMCPEKERWMREREGLLHTFEVDEKTKHLKRPKADPSKIVKCFSRPAAGQLMPDTSELRPASVLLSTIRYLFTNVVTRVDYDWVMIYDFVFDRLRAIRQEVVIQRIRGPQSVQILEPIVRFHVYAGQRLCEKNISVFDTKINSQHLLECLKQLLVLYDELEEQSSMCNPNFEENIERLSIGNNRPQMEALYMLLHLGDSSALGRGISLPHKYRGKNVKLAMKISLAWFLKNYVRTLRLIQKLPLLLKFGVLSNLRLLRRDTFQIMSAAYNSKLLTFPGLKLQEILMYRDVEKLSADCKLFNLSFAYENVQFDARKFNKGMLLANPDMYFTVQTLQKYLPIILLQDDDAINDDSSS
ncbi:germinal-center associated nuclear protein [Neodiprion pinetum]|uniref:germinal-center associated nuclear protein n=1 Tax=Neodiprion pinetum TaxID=441929 RepID=UPI001EDF6F77|nr:germinal-center associated nuclear protein [Neodiprion pinetum]XP_046468209.1 germinal-center associated nuclear protein [Neodiprion pinetum]